MKCVGCRKVKSIRTGVPREDDRRWDGQCPAASESGELRTHGIDPAEWVTIRDAIASFGTYGYTPVHELTRTFMVAD